MTDTPLHTIENRADATTVDVDAIEGRASAAKHSPWTHSPQKGEPKHCLQAQVWDENGHSLATLEPSIMPDLATATAAHIAGLHPEVVLAICARLRASSSELASEREKFLMHTAHVGAWFIGLLGELGLAKDGDNTDVATACSMVMDEAKWLKTIARASSSQNAALRAEGEIMREALKKVIKPALDHFNSEKDCGGWPDDTGLFIMRADEGEEDFTLGDLRRAPIASAPI